MMYKDTAYTIFQLLWCSAVKSKLWWGYFFQIKPNRDSGKWLMLHHYDYYDIYYYYYYYWRASVASETLTRVTLTRVTTQLKIGDVCLFIYICLDVRMSFCTLTFLYLCVSSLFDPVPNFTKRKPLV